MQSIPHAGADPPHRPPIVSVARQERVEVSTPESKEVQGHGIQEVANFTDVAVEEGLRALSGYLVTSLSDMIMYYARIRSSVSLKIGRGVRRARAQHFKSAVTWKGPGKAKLRGAWGQGTKSNQSPLVME